MSAHRSDIRHFVWRKKGLGNRQRSRRSMAAGFCNLQFAIYNLQSIGGIAQLVERQLCKLEVRGSNPLASSLRSRRREERRLSRRSLGEGGHFSTLCQQ